MMKKVKRCLSLLLALLVLMSMAACTAPEGGNYDVPALMQSILRQVRFDAELIEHKDGWLSFFEEPEFAQVAYYYAKGQIADEVALITLKSEKDMAAAEAAVNTHIQSLRNQFQQYAPEETVKYDKAVIWKHENYLLLCVTADYASVKLILEHADDPHYQLPDREDPPASSSDSQNDPPASSSSESSSSSSSSSSESTGDSGSDTGDDKPSVRPDGYPAIYSQSGKYSTYPGTSMIRVDNSAFEICGYNDAATGNYASLVNKVAAALKGKTKVYSLPIPTAFGVMLPDDIRASYPDYKDQGQSIEKLFAKMSSNVIPVRTYHNLMSHRDEYLYFRTDHHWNGIGAYYAYESFCETKGFAPYTMEQRKEKQVGNFLGSLYYNSNKDKVLLADTIYAYYPYSESATMTYYEKDGTGKNWPIVSGNSGYTLFAAGDKPLAVFTNPEVTDGSVCIVIKESYGNALMPYLVDHYSTIYEIDYRHWTGDDLVAYAKSVNANDLIFANNVMMINTPSLIAKLGAIIK